MESSGDDVSKTTKKHRRKKIAVLWALCVTILVLLGLFLGTVLFSNVSRHIKIPEKITSSFPSSIYLPKKLPGNYRVVDDSFTVNTDGVLIFQAKDDAGGTIVFTEQPKPVDFNFDDFYSTQLADAKTLDNTPFPSVYGTGTTNKASVLSIVTDETWIIASTTSPVGDNLQDIASNLTKKD